MWTVLKAWLLKLILKRSLGALLAALLAILMPIAAVLKVVGIPLLFVMLIVGLPLLLLLAVIGLPFLIVAGGAMAILGIISAVLFLGFALLKIALPILAIVWLVRWLFGERKDRNGKEKGAEPPPPPDPGTDPA